MSTYVKLREDHADNAIPGSAELWLHSSTASMGGYSVWATIFQWNEHGF